ncbi:MAG: pitrilysin family protein [Roseovarius sp.]|nr:pitrilysin family protein [Roseovarius sp.]MCY4208551.1 pitrilysin family protein [Roseovarius sp.]MCY4290946.1 pitrilysin family protein [Roseovarius sp.]
MTVNVTTLPNGFRVATDHMPGLKSASVGIWVYAGSRHEEAHQNGIAHFLEHMMFKGTSSRNAIQIVEAIENVGGDINAYTGRDTTAYFARVLENDVLPTVNVLADMILDSVMDTSDIENERGVILQEIGEMLDTPDDIIFELLDQAAFPNHPIGRCILGTGQTVGGFRRDDLMEFRRSHYVPDRMVLSAAGAVCHDSLARAAEKLFGHMERREPPPVLPARFVGGESRTARELEQVHFAMAFETPPLGDVRVNTSSLYTLALGGSNSSRLFQQLREKRGLCYTVSARDWGCSDTGMMVVYAGTSGRDVHDLSHILVEEMNRAAHDMTQAELDRAKTQIRTGFVMGMESPRIRAERLAQSIKIFNRVRSPDEILENVESVALGDLRDFAGHVASRSSSALAMYGPLESAPTFESLQQRRAA